MDRINSVQLDPRAVQARAEREAANASLTAEERMRQIILDRRVQRANYAKNVLLGGWR